MPVPDRIEINPEILAGKPVVRGTRLSVDFLLGLMAEGWTEQEIVEEYPGLTRDDLLACLAYAVEILRSEKVFPVQAA